MATAAPQLSPVREFAPINLSVPHDDKVAETTAKLDGTQISGTYEKKATEKLESGAPVTEAEATLLESQKHRELGRRPEAGSTAAMAKSAADKRENFQQVVEKIGSKLEKDPERVTAEDAAYVESREHRVTGHRPDKDSISAEAKRVTAANERAADAESAVEDDTTDSKTIPPAVQSYIGKEKNFQDAVDLIEPKIANAPDTVTKEDADLLHSREVRAHGGAEKGGITAQAQSLAVKNEQSIRAA